MDFKQIFTISFNFLYLKSNLTELISILFAHLPFHTTSEHTILSLHLYVSLTPPKILFLLYNYFPESVGPKESSWHILYLQIASYLASPVVLDVLDEPQISWI